MKSRIEYFLQEHIQNFISENLDTDLDRILFNKKNIDLDIKLVVEQIKCRKKARQKLPYFSLNPKFFYIPLSLEQATSEKVAQFKASLFSGKTCLDLTGGMGVDSFYWSKSFNKVHYIEQNESVYEATTHNFKSLSLKNINLHLNEAFRFLEHFKEEADLIYLDPARRRNDNSKVFYLEDYEPNVLLYLELLVNKSKQVLIKTSPMLDIQKAIEELKYVEKVIIISLKNEVKEVSYLLNKNPSEIQVECYEINQKGEQSFTIQRNQESTQKASLSTIKQYIYEPYNSALKAQVFNAIATHYQIDKLNPNSHLYTSSTPIKNFFGRCFEVIATTKFSKKEVSKILPNKKANIATRNFPVNTHEVRKKLNLKEGGDFYIFATTDVNNNKIILICKKITD